MAYRKIILILFFELFVVAARPSRTAARQHLHDVMFFTRNGHCYRVQCTNSIHPRRCDCVCVTQEELFALLSPPVLSPCIILQNHFAPTCWNCVGRLFFSGIQILWLRLLLFWLKFFFGLFLPFRRSVRHFGAAAFESFFRNFFSNFFEIFFEIFSEFFSNFFSEF